MRAEAPWPRKQPRQHHCLCPTNLPRVEAPPNHRGEPHSLRGSLPCNEGVPIECLSLLADQRGALFSKQFLSTFTAAQISMVQTTASILHTGARSADRWRTWRTMPEHEDLIVACQGHDSGTVWDYYSPAQEARLCHAGSLLQLREREGGAASEKQSQPHARRSCRSWL